MPHFNPTDPLAIPQLFQHQFDIDAIILALCGPAPVWLNTTNGTLSPTKPTAPESHCFALEPLPASFISNLSRQASVGSLTPAEQASLAALLPTLTITSLPHQLAHGGRIGGWLHTQVKEAALEWLDTHNLIPPSMRHINRRVAPATNPGLAAATVRIEESL